MNRRECLTLLATAATLTAAARASPSVQTTAVRTLDETWHDARRARNLPLRIRVPAAATDAPRPVVLFSHGLGGSRAGGAAWGEHWAAHGYLVIHLQHPGSDESLWRESAAFADQERPATRAARLRAGASVEQALARLADVRFVLDELARRHGTVPPASTDWPRLADLSRVAMSGHSFGARTTMALAGERFPANLGGGLEPRLRAFIAFSPAVPTGPLAPRSESALRERFAGITRPFLAITGQRDGDVLGNGATPENRARVFDLLPPGNKYLANFALGDHAVFGGGPAREQAWMRAMGAGSAAVGTPPDAWAPIQAAVARITTAFFDAHLRQDADAQRWLAGDAANRLEAALEWRVK